VALPQAHTECSPDILTGFKSRFAGAEKGKKELKRTEGMKEGGGTYKGGERRWEKVFHSSSYDPHN